MTSRKDLLSGQSAEGSERSGRPERADAARNRAKVLAAAGALFATRDPREVTMDDIAKAAGVGRGTLYRRYPDTAAIAQALLDEHERDLQERLMRGAPPLGPGAPPAERLAAFYTAMVELLEGNSALALGAEPGRLRFAAGAYGFWRAHVRALVAEAGVPDPDALVDVLLAPLAAEVYTHQRDLGVPPERIAEALGRLARGVLA
ncbi:TetR/AcrR family transcriptional regulator [Actinomadura barringtoniae]|uniref:TetR/AcrR family transcriptional regulator n=1 Tax=Actinomadura barringtoniae TaxID=1427535 RepID=A0A939P9M1_9ACTN|nr:TetR/AcrR family transcriptional regulator [Actinomadura barringtoniae]MBO2448037.1 TetR/AcrR family transcriptional regulator [Actinomadura barringtoniae]